MGVYKIGLLRQVRKHLRSGGVIAYPTESCYGLGCDPFNYRGLSKLLYLKRRSPLKGLIVVAGKYKYITKLIKPLSNLDYQIVFKQYWPGAYSLILPIKHRLLTPRRLTGNRDSIAVRLTKHREIRQLSNYLQQPLTSTSANISGNKTIKSYKEAKAKFGSKVLVVPGVIGLNKSPSTIINWANKQLIR